MNDEDKTKEQLISELKELRQRLTEIEISETLQERVAEVLLKSESQYRTTLDSMGDMVHVIDTELRFILFNTSFKRMNIELGFETDVIGKKISDVYSFLPDRIFDEYHQVFETGKALIIEERITIRGRKFITETRKIPIFEEGRVSQIVTVIHDNTERKTAEENIKEMKDKYESLIENIPDAIYSALADATSTTTFVSERITNWTGYSPVDFYENDNLWAKCIHPEDRQLAVETFINAYTNKKEYIFEYRMVHKETGQIYHLRDHGVPIRDNKGQIIRFDGILTDISERKQAEEALLESEKKYRLINENIPVVVYSALPDEHSTNLFISGRVEELTGYTGEQFLADSTLWERIVHPDDIGYVWEAIEAHRLKKEPLDVEYRIITKDNAIKWIRDRGNPALDERNRFVRIDGYMEDITERKQAEDALIESEEKYRSLFEDSRNAIYITTREGKLINFNQAMIDLFGFSRDELSKLNVRELYIDPTDRSRFQREIEQKGSVRNYELTLRKKENTEIDCLFTATVRRDNDGNIMGYQGIIRDITERKKLERQLIESEEKYRTLVEKDPNMIYLVKDGKVAFANQALLNTLGYSAKEIYDMDLDILSAIVPGQREMIKERLKKRIAGENVPESYEFSLMTKNGEIIPCLLNTTSFELEGTRIIQGVLTDISEVMTLEKELKESEERYRGLYNSTIDGIVSQDTEGNILDCNQAFIDMHGYTKEEIYQLTLQKLIPSKWNKIIDRMINEQLIPYGYSAEFEIEGTKKDGTIFPVSVRSWLTKNKEGRPLEVWSIIRDITERKRSEEALVESEERYRGLYESSIDGIVSADGENIIECNQAFADMLGYTKEEIKKMNYTDFVPSKWYDDLARALIEPMQKKGYSDEYQLEIVKKDGSLIPVSISAWLMRDKEGFASKGWAIIRDISEKRKTEEELHKIEKLESLGILAGGIAHDFNNILTGILGNITLAKMYAPFREKVLERLSEAEKATLRARDLTQQLLTFSKGGAPVKKTASIEDLLRDTTVFTLSGSNVKCRFSIPEDIWSVEIDEGQISQVLNNLIINADQAMPGGGIISISTENVIIGTKDVLPLQEGRYIKLSIKDQGIGIPEEYLQKIFDPYFTTKQKGSGLGLTIAYSIIKNHKGHIAVESKLGVGSDFSIYLPALKTQVPKKKEVEKRPITGKGKIMVMDDEEVIRDSLGEILTFLGYEVGFARNGEEAIALYKRTKDTGQSFDAVILDLTIRGGMGGKETIGKLIEIDPKVKAIVSSGYSTDPVMADFKNYGFRGVVAKPYDIKELSEALNNVLNGIEPF